MRLTYCQRSLQEIYSINCPKYLCFPTNIYLTKYGSCFLFGTFNDIVKNDYPDAIWQYGQMLKKQMYGVHIMKVINYNVLLSFPTRTHFRKSTNPKIVYRSCCQLLRLQQDEKLIKDLKIYLPLRIDGQCNFTLDDLITYIKPIIEQINNLQIVLY